MDEGGAGMIRICLHGAESTGKSVLAARMERELGVPWVPEYGRTYCEERGTDLTMDDLLAIAAGQDAAQKAAEAAHRDAPIMLFDTDPLMTAAWAQMLFGVVPDALMACDKADVYLLFAADVPWVEDGTRLFGTLADRAQFARIAEDVLLRAGLPYRRISGDWSAREQQLRAVLAEYGVGNLTAG